MKFIATLYMIICSFAIFCSVDSANLKESSEPAYGRYRYGNDHGNNYGQYGRYGRYDRYGDSQKYYYGHN